VENLYSHTLTALQFFTRLPIPQNEKHDSDLAKSAIAFPIAGLVIGALVGLAWFLASQILPPLVAAGLALGFSILLTGALHEDGFADCADGLGGGNSPERALEIMRDSRIGAYGAVALTMTLGLRWAALTTMAASTGLFALIIAHTVSRSAITIALSRGTYARTDGLGTSVAKGIEEGRFWLIITIAVLLGLALGGMVGLISAIMALLAAWLFLVYLKHRLGGYTGDGLGAMQQIAEITVLVVMASNWA